MSVEAGAAPVVRSSARVSDLVRERVWAISVWAAMAVWSVALFVVARDAYVSFRVGRFDLGNMVQAVWSTTQGRPLETTNSSNGEEFVRLGGHVDPFLVLLAPLWMVWQSPLVLAFAQIAAVSLGALPVFWLARRHTGSERIGGLLAFVYLVYPWTATSAVASIHPVTFAIPLLLFCIWFLDTDRLFLFTVCAVLVMSTGELMPLPVAALGIWYALARGHRKAGAVIAAVAAAWTFVALYVVVPAFTDGGSSQFYGFYDQIGGSPTGVVRTLFTDPGAILGALTESSDIAYLLWLAVPLCGLFFLSPGLAAVALPQLLVNTLSDFRSMTDPRYHSLAGIVPFLVAATVLAVTRMRTSRRAPAVASVLVVSGVIALAVGPWPRIAGVTPLGGRPTPSQEHRAALASAVALVPAGVAVTASNPVGSHLSARRYVYSIPLLQKAEWVVVDLDDPWTVRPDSPILNHHPEVVRGFAARLARDPGWRKVFERDRVLVFRKATS
jgi:uncharacterized membrane protein